MDYGYIKNGKVYRNAFLNFPEKEIGTVKDSEEATIQYFTDRFQNLLDEIAEVQDKIESQSNKGSFLMKVINLKESLPTMDGLGDFESVHNKLGEIESELNTYIDQNRHKNLQIKTALLEELKSVASSHEWKSATEAIKEIQQKWIKTGAVDSEHKDKIEGEYKQLTNQFFERKSAFYAEIEKMMQEKEADYEEFLKKAKEKITKGSSNFKTLKADLMTEWKELGKIRHEKHATFWEEFQRLLKSAMKPSRGMGQGKASVEENIKRRQEILDKLSVLSESLEPKINLNQVRKEWKMAGFVPKQKNYEMNETFHRLTSLISEKIFLGQLLQKKARKDMSEQDLEKLRIRLLYDLLNRDVAELKTFEENVEKFNTAKGLDHLLDQKLFQQKRKVEVKKEILDQLKGLQNGN